MDKDIKDIINKVSMEIMDHALNSEPIYPNVDTIIDLINKIIILLFPGYHKKFEWEHLRSSLFEIHDILCDQIGLALTGSENVSDDKQLSAEISASFIDEISAIKQALIKDATAGFDGDPAAKSVDEVILSYPGFYAIFVYRIAHSLFLKKVPIIPRMMTEHAHSKTGIDIHPGAKIGEYFFIDHGTGVVIGETTTIGNHVKIYQGVTLGALSLKKGQKLAGLKRHPTIEDHVTIYSGASILGGETVIGKNSTISGNAFIIASVPQNTKI